MEWGRLFTLRYIPGARGKFRNPITVFRIVTTNRRVRRRDLASEGHVPGD